MEQQNTTNTAQPNPYPLMESFNNHIMKSAAAAKDELITAMLQEEGIGLELSDPQEIREAMVKAGYMVLETPLTEELGSEIKLIKVIKKRVFKIDFNLKVDIDKESQPINLDDVPF